MMFSDFISFCRDRIAGPRFWIIVLTVACTLNPERLSAATVSVPDSQPYGQTPTQIAKKSEPLATVIEPTRSAELSGMETGLILFATCLGLLVLITRNRWGHPGTWRRLDIV